MVMAKWVGGNGIGDSGGVANGRGGEEASRKAKKPKSRKARSRKEDEVTREILDARARRKKSARCPE